MTWSSSAGADTGSPPPTIWPPSTASRTSRCSKRAGSEAGNTGRNTTIVRSNYLWDESAALYEKSLRLFEGLSRTLNFNVMFSQRGVFNLGHSVHEMRDIARRVNANRLNGIDGRLVRADELARLIPILDVSPARPLPGARRLVSSRAAASPGTMRWRGIRTGRRCARGWTSSSAAK